MARIEDYGLIGDLQTAALVGRNGSIDWACFPRFDSGACFAALLGTTDHGRWLVAPRGDAWSPGRRYRENTLVLETDWESDTGKARVIDFMPPRGTAPDIVRIVEGVAGEVEMASELVVRYDYGSTLPWVRRIDDDTRVAIAGPDALCFRSPVEHRGENMRTIGEFTVREGERVPFALTWFPSNEDPPKRIAPEPAALQIMYGVGGERRLREYTLDWLPGYEGSRPVRAGNAASDQFQLDVFGEVLDAMHQGRVHELESSPESWSLQRRLLAFLENAWKEPDDGIWEVRGGRRHFTHSKVMAWVAFDRGVKAVEQFGRSGPSDRWRKVREEIAREVCERGFDRELNSFTQTYGSKRLDASLLVLPLVGFLPADDGRMLGTVAAIERELYADGFVYRYAGDKEGEQVDGLPAGEGAFLPCTFWLADNFALQGRVDEAEELFERLLSTRNDLGLLAEEWDPASRRQLGNFPQAFTHVALVNSAFNLDRQHHATPEQRSQPAGY